MYALGPQRSSSRQTDLRLDGLYRTSERRTREAAL